MHLSDRKTLMVFISGSMHIGNILGIIVAAEFYVAGGWLLTGFLVPILDAILISALPFLGKIQRMRKTYYVLNGCDSKVAESGGNNLKDSPSKTQQVAFFFPDVAVFLNNVVYILLIYSIPPRIEKFSQKSLSTSVLFSTLPIVFSFVASLALTFITNRKIRTDVTMLISNFVFYIGAILAFGSTTNFLMFPSSYEIGSLLIGIGDAGVINLAIMSKFSLYEKWGVRTDGLAEKSTALFNFSMSISIVVGSVLGGLTTTRESEIPAIFAAIAVCLMNTAGFIACILIK